MTSGGRRYEATSARRALRWAAAVGLFVVAGVGGCTCLTRTRELGSLDEAGVKAKVVRVDVDKVELEGGPHFVVLPALEHQATHTLVIEAPIHARLPLHQSCQTDFELDVDEKGERLALRCANGPWLVAYLGKGDRAFWAMAEVEGESVDFASVPSFEAAAVELLMRATYAHEEGVRLVEELAARGDLLRETLLATLERAPKPRPKYDSTDYDVWVTGFDALEGDARAPVSAALTKAFLKPAPERFVIARFARRGTVDAETRGVATRLVEAEIARDGAYDPHHLDVGLLLRRVAREEPSALGPLACRALPKLRADALVVLAVAPVPCPDVEVDVEKACRVRSKCGDTEKHAVPTVTCSDEAMRKLARARLDDDHTSDHWSAGELEIWAAVQQPQAPPALTRGRDRMRYELESDGKSCWDTPKGGRCVCSFSALDAVCAGKEAELRGSRCEVAVDDAKRRITVTSLGPAPATSSAQSAAAGPSASAPAPAPSHTATPN